MIVLLWVSVILALVVTLAACAWMLIRTFVTLLEAIAELLATPAILDGVHRVDPGERPNPAVLEPRSVVAAEYHAMARVRQDRKLARRAARHERGLALISAKPTALN